MVPLKYGLLITLGVIAWVVIAHLLVPDPRSPVHTIGAGVFFNLLHIAGIYLAINTVRNQSNGDLVFKTGVKTGVATALIYAITSSLFFLVAIFTVGTKLMARAGCGKSAGVAGGGRCVCRVVSRIPGFRTGLFDGYFLLPG